MLQVSQEVPTFHSILDTERRRTTVEPAELMGKPSANVRLPFSASGLHGRWHFCQYESIAVSSSMNLSVLTAGHTRMIHYILSFQRAAFTVANLTSTGVIAPRLVYLLHFCLRLKEFVAANSLSHNNARLWNVTFIAFVRHHINITWMRRTRNVELLNVLAAKCKIAKYVNTVNNRYE